MLTAGAPRQLRPRRGPDAARGPAVVDRAGTLPAADRRQPRAGLLRRLRPAVPPHVLGQGRRHQPRRPGDGQGRAGPAARHRSGRRRARPRRFDVEPLAALPGQGQVGAGRGGQRREPARSRRTATRHATRRWSGATPRWPPCCAALDRARAGRGRWSSSSASRGSASPGWSRSCCAPTDVDACRAAGATSTSRRRRTSPFRALLRRGAAACPPGRRRTSAADGCATGSTANAPTCCRGCRCVGGVVDARPAVDARGRRRWTSEFRKARLEEVSGELLQRLLPEPAVLVFDDVHLMDDASADLLAQLCRGVGERPWLVVVTRRDADGRVPAPSRVRGGPGASHAARHRRVRSARRAGPRRGGAAAARSGRDRRAGRRQPAVPARARPSRPAAGTIVDALPDTVEALITSQIDRLPRARAHGAAVRLRAGQRRSQESDLRALLRGRAVPTGRRCAAPAVVLPARRRATADTASSTQLVRDTAYEGLPYRTPTRPARRARARSSSWQSPHPEDLAELLSLHYFHAGRDRTRLGTTHGSAVIGQAPSTRTSRPRSCSAAPRRSPGRCPASPTTTSRGSTAPWARRGSGSGGHRRRWRPSGRRAPVCAPTRSRRRACSSSRPRPTCAWAGSASPCAPSRAGCTCSTDWTARRR